MNELIEKKNSTAGIDKEKKNPKSLDYDLSNTKYNEQVFWNLFNASFFSRTYFRWQVIAHLLEYIW